MGITFQKKTDINNVESQLGYQSDRGRYMDLYQDVHIAMRLYPTNQGMEKCSETGERWRSSCELFSTGICMTNEDSAIEKVGEKNANSCASNDDDGDNDDSKGKDDSTL